MTQKEYLDKLNILLIEAIGTKIEHHSFGVGEIKGIVKDRVEVSFKYLNESKFFRILGFFRFNEPKDEIIKDKLDELNALYELGGRKEKKESIVKKPENKKITLNDIAGLDTAKEIIKQLIIYPFKYPEIYRTFNKSSGGGVLFYGAPGCGKTLIAKAIAEETGAHFIHVSCSDIKSKWYGESERNIRVIFEKARSYEKAIIFFDEFDALGTNRDENTNNIHDKQLVAEFLAQMDGIVSKESNNTLLVLAATNKPWRIDSALLRSGRFSKKVFIDLPDKKAIFKIFCSELNNVPQDDIEYDEFMNKLEFYSPADIVEVCNVVKDIAIMRSIDNGYITPVIPQDIIEAIKKVKSTINIVEYERLKQYVI